MRCQDCQHFIPGEKPTCKFQPSDAEIAAKVKLHPDHRPYTRNCVSAIMLARLPLMRGKILEIGPGTIKTTRNILAFNIKRRRCEWYGIDPAWRKPEAKNAYRGTVGKLPFPDGMFDHVMSFESIEHWEEYDESLAHCLRQVHRVLKPGGSFLATCPIHGHGSEIFIRGNRQEIEGLFAPPAWAKLRTEEWRKDYSPCPPALNWVIWGGGKYAETVRKHSDMAEPVMWCLEVEAWKQGA